MSIDRKNEENNSNLEQTDFDTAIALTGKN